MKVNFSLYLITDRRQVPGGGLVAAVDRALAAGVRAVQLREKDLPDEEFLPLAAELRNLTARRGAKLLINGRSHLALAVGADGVHLGGGGPSPAEVRRTLGPKALIGLSTHSVGEVAAASRAGADFVTFGPVWFTTSKASYGAPLGIEELRAACAAADLPVFALGGLTADRCPQLLSAGAAGGGCIGAILAASNPGRAAAALLRQLAPPFKG